MHFFSSFTSSPLESVQRFLTTSLFLSAAFVALFFAHTASAQVVPDERVEVRTLAGGVQVNPTQVFVSPGEQVIVSFYVGQDVDITNLRLNHRRIPALLTNVQVNHPNCQLLNNGKKLRCTTFPAHGRISYTATVDPSTPLGGTKRLKTTLRYNDLSGQRHRINHRMDWTSQAVQSQGVLEVLRTGGLTSPQTIVAGVDDITAMQMTFTNTSDNDIDIEELDLRATGTGNALPYSNFTVAAFVNGVQQGVSQAIPASGQINLGGLSIVVPAHGVRVVDFVMDTVQASAPGGIDFCLEGVDATDIVTGNNILVENGGAPLTTSNVLCGAQFNLIETGTLQTNLQTIIPSDIIVAEESKKEVLQVRFEATDDDIYVDEIILENDLNIDELVNPSGLRYKNEVLVGDRLNFFLYDETDQLIETSIMQNGVLVFNLPDQDRVFVPKNSSTFVTVKVDARPIVDANQTGMLLQLSLDSDNSSAGFAFGNPTQGITAFSGLTGATIINTNLNDFTGEDFVVYKTEFSIDHASVQPQITDPTITHQEMYRFTVTADQARQMELGRVTLGIGLQGMEHAGGSPMADLDFQMYRVLPNGTVDPSGLVALPTNVSVGVPASTNAVVTFDFQNQILAAGEARTYALFVGNLQNDANNLANDDGISVNILRDTSYESPSSRNSMSTALIWSDMSDQNHSNSTLDWLGGYLVDTPSMTLTNAD